MFDKLFCPQLKNFHNKLECLYLPSLSNQVKCWRVRPEPIREQCSQSLEYAGKACQGQTLQLNTKISKLWTKKFYSIGSRCPMKRFAYRYSWTTFTIHFHSNLRTGPISQGVTLHYDCKDLQGTNNPAYCTHLKFTKKMNCCEYDP